MNAILEALDGKKTWIGFIMGLVAGALWQLGYIDDAQAGWAGTVAAGVFTGGAIHKWTKGQEIAKQIVQAIAEMNAKIFLAGALLGLAFAGSPAQAADCDFAAGADLKVVRFAWPPSIGWNLGFVDFEAGFPGPVDVCGNASANLVGGLCVLPKVGGWLGGFCPSEPDPQPEPAPAE